MKTLIATALVAASLFAGIATVSSANAADFGSRAWWDQQTSNG